jgi:two-component system nitrogen regulation response regulator GlnG
MVREGAFREDLFMRLNPATAITLPTLRERRDDFLELLQFFVARVCADGYNRDLLVQYAQQRALQVPEVGEPVGVSVGRKVPSRLEPGRIHLLFHPSAFNLLRDFDWPGNFRQLEMVLSNLLTFTLVELVERAAEVEPGDAGLESRPEVVPVQPRIIRELLRPWAEDAQEGEGTPDGNVVRVLLRPSESLNSVSQDVERQYLEQLYKRADGDLARVAQQLLGDVAAGRKVQLRMNQLGIKLRELKRVRPG